jgi:hypothetical protein
VENEEEEEGIFMLTANLMFFEYSLRSLREIINLK